MKVLGVARGAGTVFDFLGGDARFRRNRLEIVQCGKFSQQRLLSRVSRLLREKLTKQLKSLSVGPAFCRPHGERPARVTTHSPSRPRPPAMERARGPRCRCGLGPSNLGRQVPLGLPDHAALGVSARRARVRQPRRAEGRREPRGAALPGELSRPVRRGELPRAARRLSDRVPGPRHRHHHDDAAASVGDADRGNDPQASSRSQAHPRRAARHAGLFGEEARSEARRRERPRPSLGGAARSRLRRAVQRRRRACDLRGAQGRRAEGDRRRRSEGRTVSRPTRCSPKARCRRGTWSI